MIAISSIATIDSYSKVPTMPYGFGWLLPIIPPNMNDLNLPPDALDILATLAVANPKEEGHDENYSPQSPELSKLSPTSTPTMNFNKIDGREATHTTTDIILSFLTPVTNSGEFIFSHQALQHRRHHLAR